MVETPTAINASAAVLRPLLNCPKKLQQTDFQSTEKISYLLL